MAEPIVVNTGPLVSFARIGCLDVIGRLPTPDESTVALQFLANQTVALNEAKRPAVELAVPAPLEAGVDPSAGAALTDFCLALFNLNEFVYVD